MKLNEDFALDQFPGVCAVTHYQFAQKYFCGNDDWDPEHFIEVASAQELDKEFRRKCDPMTDFQDVWKLLRMVLRQELGSAR